MDKKTESNKTLIKDYIQKAKYGMELSGFPCGLARPPLMELSASEKAEFKVVFENMKRLKDREVKFGSEGD